MKEKENKLPRATAEQAREYDALLAQAAETSSFEEKSAIQDKVIQMESSFDWSNSEFTDPVTGKKGVKDVTGRILIPARYDEFHYIGSYVFCHIHPKAARKGELWGIVASDGSGEELSDFRFRNLYWNSYSGLFEAWWGDSQKFGLVTKTGEVFIPNVLTSVSEPWNDCMLLENEGKVGALDIRTYHFVLPEYDRADTDGDDDVTFIKDGVEGYVVEETGEFVTKEQYENDERYYDAYFFNTNINI